MKFFDREKEIAKLRDIDLKTLERKSEAFFAKNPRLRSREVSFSGLSLDDL